MPDHLPYTLHLGDCLQVLKTFPDNSFDSVVTDPPYALPGGFMAKDWDNFDGREDAGFGYWLAGFTDGEGHFRVQKHERGSHTCVFQIKVRDDDRAVLERIKRFVGAGAIYSGDGSGNANPQCAFVVQDKEGCARLVALFRKYPLTAKKALDFEVWAEAVEEWLGRPRGNRWNGMADQACAAALKARLEDVRRYTDVPWSGHKFQDWVRLWARECLRVLKPGGHLLAFGAARQYHRLACGLEDAGFEIRDQIMWVFGSGFPKSHNLSGEFEGWGTALKPGHEPICMARKPLVGTVAANVLAHGTGALNIDACRIPTGEALRTGSGGIPCRHDEHVPRTRSGEASAERRYIETGGTNFAMKPGPRGGAVAGRWPANLIHDGSTEVVALFPADAGQAAPLATRNSDKTRNSYGTFAGSPDAHFSPHDAGGSAARFFYCAKASRKDRNEGCDEFPQQRGGMVSNTSGKHITRRDGYEPPAAGNHHPTVKPTDLMAYLVRLVTPPGGKVLDPFTGSGSTGKAAVREGFEFVGIEREPPYLAIAEARIAHELERVTAAAEDAAKGSAQLDIFHDAKKPA